MVQLSEACMSSLLLCERLCSFATLHAKFAPVFVYIFSSSLQTASNMNALPGRWLIFFLPTSPFSPSLCRPPCLLAHLPCLRARLFVSTMLDLFVCLSPSSPQSQSAPAASNPSARPLFQFRLMANLGRPGMCVCTLSHKLTCMMLIYHVGSSASAGSRV
ncbi:unnamed protein product [Protopolystoma xenopodis]|uniref:Uncharacterized protein n=1 Tax=Protopolystoma xenopodis TaxID=117903 RepID=A0A448XSQ6_9PLAT|nr:unnamed protein product [Protopolystoma xenopodis]